MTRETLDQEGRARAAPAAQRGVRKTCNSAAARNAGDRRGNREERPRPPPFVPGLRAEAARL
jgi:hypothetical protein